MWQALLARIGAAAVVLALLPAPGAALVVLVPAARDNTLIETSDGSLSNGAGAAVFAGRTGQLTGSRRRGIVAFDVAGAVPAGASIDAVSLGIHVSGGNLPGDVAIHRVLEDWGEGSSVSGGGGGQGAPSTDGDATWLHSFYPASLWSAPGGDFRPTPSAIASVVTVNAFASWSSAAMAADVQGWLDDPSGSFGWILLGNEARAGTSIRFDSRESADPALRPVLRVSFTPIPEPSSALLLAAGLAAAAARRAPCSLGAAGVPIAPGSEAPGARAWR